MSSNEAEWNAKHSLAAKETAEAPTGILTELWPLLPTGAALDLACGRGRNAIFLAEHGRPVTAVDWSAAALDILEERALSLKIPVRRIRGMGEVKQATRLGIDVVQADLESTGLEVNGYFLILCVRYLQRSLFRQISGGPSRNWRRFFTASCVRSRELPALRRASRKARTTVNKETGEPFVEGGHCLQSRATVRML
jgi:SAM-dependent methyltransferase